jgi:hypothetical protein
VFVAGSLGQWFFWFLLHMFDNLTTCKVEQGKKWNDNASNGNEWHGMVGKGKEM